MATSGESMPTRVLRQARHLTSFFVLNATNSHGPLTTLVLDPDTATSQVQNAKDAKLPSECHLPRHRTLCVNFIQVGVGSARKLWRHGLHLPPPDGFLNVPLRYRAYSPIGKSNVPLVQ